MRKQLIALGLILITSFIGYTVDTRGGADADELIKEQMAPFINTEGEVTAYGNNSILKIYDDTLANESNAVPLTVADNHLKTEQYFMLLNPRWIDDDPVKLGYTYLRYVSKVSNRCLYSSNECFWGMIPDKLKTPFNPVFTVKANDQYEEIINAPTNAKKRARLAGQLGSFYFRQNRLSSEKLFARGYLATVKNKPGLTVFVISDITNRSNIPSKGTNRVQGKLTKLDLDYYFSPLEDPKSNYRLVFNEIANQYSRIGSSVKKLLDDNIDKIVDIAEGNLVSYDTYSVWLPNDLNEPIISNPEFVYSYIQSEDYKIDLEKNTITYTDIATGKTDTLDISKNTGYDSKANIQVSEPDKNERNYGIDKLAGTGCLERSPSIRLNKECRLHIGKNLQTGVAEVELVVRPWITVNAPKDCKTDYPNDDLLVKYNEQYPAYAPDFRKNLYSIDPAIKDLVKFTVGYDAFPPMGVSNHFKRSDYLARNDTTVNRYYRPAINPTGDGWKKFPEYLCSDKNSFKRGERINLPSPEELSRYSGVLDFSLGYNLDYDRDEPINEPKPDYHTQPGEEIGLAMPCNTLTYKISQGIELPSGDDVGFIRTVSLEVSNSSSQDVTLEIDVVDKEYLPTTKGEVYPKIKRNILSTTNLAWSFKKGRTSYDIFDAETRWHYSKPFTVSANQVTTINLGEYEFSNSPLALNKALVRFSKLSFNSKCPTAEIDIPVKILSVPTISPTAPAISAVPTLPCTNLDFKVRTVYINKKSGYTSNIVLEIENKATVATTANLATIGIAYKNLLVNNSDYTTKYAITKLNSTTLPSPKVTETGKYEPLVKEDIKKQTHEFANVNIPANTKTLISLGNFTFNDRAPGLVGFYKNLKLDYLTARISNYSWNKDCVKDVPVVIIFGTDPNPVPTPAPTNTATPAPTATATPKPTATATPKASPSATPTPTIVSKPNPSNRPSPTATATTAPTPVPTNTTKPTPTATASTRPTNTNSPRPTVSATPKQTPTPTPKPKPKPNTVQRIIRDIVNAILRR